MSQYQRARFRINIKRANHPIESLICFKCFFNVLYYFRFSNFVRFKKTNFSRIDLNWIEAKSTILVVDRCMQLYKFVNLSIFDINVVSSFHQNIKETELKSPWSTREQYLDTFIKLKPVLSHLKTTIKLNP